MDRGNSQYDFAESRHDAVMRTIAEMQPDCVMEAFLDPQNYDILFKSLPAAPFIEAFRLLSPDYFAKEYIKLHRYFHPAIADVKGYKPLKQRCDEFFGNITTIAHTRRKAGHSLGLQEYTHLLDCARTMGHGYMAYQTWKDMIHDGVTPNLECYNYYMEARVWDMAYNAKEKFNLRVTPQVLRKRSLPFRNPGFQGYKTGPDGVKDKVSDLFTFMTEKGIQGDEHTFVNVMVASSREGHMNGVKNILNAVWGIDVDLLSSTEDEKTLPEVRKYARTSPLYPSGRLLHAVAHIFGTNHDFPSGLQTVDFIARKYDIPIPEQVWLELLEWAFVLSVKRNGPKAWENNPGKIPPDAVVNIFNTMTSAPYNVKPSLAMYNLLVKASWNRQSLPSTLEYMRAGLSLFRKNLTIRNQRRSRLSKLHTLFHEAQKQQHTQQIFNPFQKDYYTLSHDYSLAQITVARDATLLERWTRLLINGRRHWMHRNAEWERRLLPDMIEEWKAFFPKHVYYQMSGGTVSFHPEQSEDGKKWQSPDQKGDIGIREKGETLVPLEVVERRILRSQERRATIVRSKHQDRAAIFARKRRNVQSRRQRHVASGNRNSCENIGSEDAKASPEENRKPGEV